MLDDIISKYLLGELKNIKCSSIAILDKNQKVIWFNQNFKGELNTNRITGKKISTLFPNIENQLIDFNDTKKKRLILSDGGKHIKITKLKVKNKINGYLLEIESDKSKETSGTNISNIYYRNFVFQEELQKILQLLVKETSIINLTEQILKSASRTSDSDFGIAVFFADSKKYDFYYYDPKNCLIDKEELKKGINSNLSFIKKWLSVNKKSLIAKDIPGNIGYSLARTVQCQSVIISPGYFNQELVAAFLMMKLKNDFNPLEITHVENFAAILSFAITSIRTNELNKALENKLLQSQKLEIIGKLSSGMAHDFNNLLTSIFGSLNLLRKKLPKNENISKLLDNIENNSIRAKDLTKGLLSFGKPTTPKRKELIKPGRILSEINKVVTQTFPKTVNFTCEYAKNLSDISGSSTEIYQVLLNLCVNAKDAVSKKGDVSLIVKNLNVNPRNVIEYPLLEKGNYVWFSLKDNGSGIDEENIFRIFDPYFSTKENKTGSGFGLGLYVTYGIIKAHNGYIDVSSKKGEGTTFDVFIPAYEPNKKIVEDISGKIILLADDVVMLRNLLSELLESVGYNVIKVVSGEEVLRVLTEEIKVDLAIIDYNMQGMNGIDCISQIRKLKLNIPVILATGSISSTKDLNLEKEGIDSLIYKPYEFGTLLDIIKKLI